MFASCSPKFYTRVRLNSAHSVWTKVRFAANWRTVRRELRHEFEFVELNFTIGEWHQWALSPNFRCEHWSLVNSGKFAANERSLTIGPMCRLNSFQICYCSVLSLDIPSFQRHLILMRDRSFQFQFYSTSALELLIQYNKKFLKEVISPANCWLRSIIEHDLFNTLRRIMCDIQLDELHRKYEGRRTTIILIFCKRSEWEVTTRWIATRF